MYRNILYSYYFNIIRLSSCRNVLKLSCVWSLFFNSIGAFDTDTQNPTWLHWWYLMKFHPSISVPINLIVLRVAGQHILHSHWIFLFYSNGIDNRIKPELFANTWIFCFLSCFIFFDWKHCGQDKYKNSSWATWA